MASATKKNKHPQTSNNTAIITEASTRKGPAVSASSYYADQMAILLESLVHDKKRILDLERDLKLAIGLANHRDQEAHDHLAQTGAITLWSHFLVHSYNNLKTMKKGLSIHHIQQMCTLLYLFSRCSGEHTAVALQGLECDLVCCCFWIMADTYDEYQQQPRQRPASDDVASDGGVATDRFTDWAKSIIRRVVQLDLALPRLKNGKRLIGFLQRILREKHSVDVENDDGVTTYLAEEAMRLLDGLAQHKENKRLLMDTPGLVHDVVQATSVATNNSSVTGRGEASSSAVLDFLAMRYLRKLAWDKRHQLRIAQTRGFVDFLINNTQRQSQPSIQKEALGVFWTLSFDFASCKILLAHPNDAALRVLCVAASLPQFQKLALPALHRMVRRNQEKTTSSKQQKTKQQLLELSNDSITRNRQRQKGGSSSSSSIPEQEFHMARLVESMCRFTSVNEPCHTKLMGALSTMSESSSEAIRLWAAKAFYGQALMKVNQFFLARTPAILRHVVQLAKDPADQVRERAASVLLQLTMDCSNAKVLGLNYHLLEALLFNARRNRRQQHAKTLPASSSSSPGTATGVREYGNMTPKARRLSIQGILSLASQEVSKGRIAKHHDCVSTLASFGVSNDADLELKQAALHGVIMLVPLL